MSTAPVDVPDEATREAQEGLSDFDSNDSYDAEDPGPGEEARGGSLLQDLADVLRNAGLTVQEVDGWKQRQRGGSGYQMARPQGIIVHHTASPKSWDGKRDVDYMTKQCEAKPLANLYLDRSGRFWVLAAGATNTNGKGGPWQSIPQNGANSRVIGIEAGNDGVGEAWPDVMQEAYVKGVAALAAAYRIDTKMILSHQEWAPGRKVDPSGPSRFGSKNASGSWNMDNFRAAVAQKRGESGHKPVAPPETKTTTNTYVVQPGDTWWKITEKTLGNPKSNWPGLAAANGGASRVLHPGEVLTIPGAAPSGGSATPAFPGEARLDDRGPVVLSWQKALIGRNVIRDTQGNRDSHYGPGMRDVVLNLQRSWSWKDADGVAGKHTWTKLHGGD
jgi:LysM repeat protein